MNEQTDGIAVYDGNTLAGPLSEVFAVELTTAVGRCRSCGTSSQVATFRVYGPEPGLVGRCPHCEDVLMRLARTPDALWIDFSGVSALRISMPPTPPAVDSWPASLDALPDTGEYTEASGGGATR